MAFDYTLLSAPITQTLGILGPLIIVAISSIAVTRNTRHLRLIAFPMAVGWSRIGIEIHPIITIALAITWAVTLVGSYVIGSMMTAAESDIWKGVERRRQVRESVLDKIREKAYEKEIKSTTAKKEARKSRKRILKDGIQIRLEGFRKNNKQQTAVQTKKEGVPELEKFLIESTQTKRSTPAQFSARDVARKSISKPITNASLEDKIERTIRDLHQRKKRQKKKTKGNA